MTSLRQGLVVGLLAGILAGILWLTGALERPENLTWDWRVKRLAEPSEASDQIKLVLLDQDSLDWGSRENGLSWPWPREMYSAVVSFCQRAEVRSLSFDVLYTEPSVYGVWDDQALGDALADGLPTAVAAHVAQDGTVAWPVDAVRHGATLIGDVSGLPDQDGVIRRARLTTAASDTTLPSLGAAAYLLRQSTYLDIQPKILGYTGPYNTLSAAAIIQSELRIIEGQTPTIDPATLHDCHILFGFSAPGLLDQRPTPLDRVSPGVVVHATVLDNLLTDSFMSGSPTALVLIVALILGILAGILAVKAAQAWQTVALFSVGLLLPITTGALLYRLDIWWPVMPGTVAVAGALVMGLGVNWATEGRRRRYLKQAFRHYLSPHVIEQLVKDPGKLELGGERRELTIMFSDLANFTGLSESLDPVALTTLLNNYLTAMTDIILDEGGTLDKYEGDAIIAFWNAPLDVPDHAARAARAAVRCQQELARQRPAWKKYSGHDLHMRVGLHTGEVVVGNLGSKQRFDYSMLGDAANLASRLEGVNKVFGTGILVSQATIEGAGDAVRSRELGRVQVVGRQEPVTVYELGGMDDDQEPESWKTYHKALELCRSGHAIEAHQVAAGLTDDQPAQALARALADDSEFRGLWQLTRK